MLDHELIRWPESQQDRHAPIATVEKAAPRRARSVLPYRECPDVTELAAIEVPGRPVVYGMRLLPVAERKERDQSEARADPVIGPPAREVRAMATVVLDDEESHVQSRGR